MMMSKAKIINAKINVGETLLMVRYAKDKDCTDIANCENCPVYKACTLLCEAYRTLEKYVEV